MLLSLPPRPSSRPRLIADVVLRAGDMLAGRYRVLSLVRADRACAYLAAVQAGTNTRVEVQILLAMDDVLEPVQLRFLADARKALLLQGPHIDRVIHVGVTEDGHPFVVREPPSGQSLATLLAEVGSLPTEAAVEIAIAVCEALQTAHVQGLVHGELDATAVHLTWTPDGPSNVKVVGLGTSRALGMLPLDGRALGALAIHAPERLTSDRELDARADIWGVGVLLYTMLAGSPPFMAEAPATVYVSAALDEPALLAGVPDSLAELVDACLSRTPVLRPQSAAVLAAKLAVFGARPVVENRSLHPVGYHEARHIVVETGPYEALVLERLVKEAAPGASEQSIDVEMSLPDLSALAANDKTPEPVVVTASVPPVAFSVAPPPLLVTDRRARSSSKARIFMMVAAACVAIGGLSGVALQRASSFRPSGAARASAASPAAVTTEAPPPALDLPNAAAPSVAAEVAAAKVPTLAVSQLPAMAPTPRARPAAPRPGSPAAKARAPESASPPAPAADPVLSAPVQPQPKANEDDLRRFLDDRR